MKCAVLFSILNYNEKTRLVEFGIKDLGDYTHQLINQIAVGKKATVEGGYGYFQVPSDMNQVWVGAGIGIVPLLSRLYWLQKATDKATKNIEKIHLFYCVNNEKEAFSVQPQDVRLPKSKMSAEYVFARETDYFVYPNNYNHFVKYYKNTYQHGGVSLEEVIIPCAIYNPK